MKQIEYDRDRLELEGMLFTWDDEKKKINIRKHEIDFSSAAAVFFDDYVTYYYNFIDDVTSEEQFSITGWLAGEVLFVVYVERVTERQGYNPNHISTKSRKRGEKNVMLMGIDDVLALAKTPEERQSMKERLWELMEMKDEDIDFSDIPRITDFSRFRRAKPYFDAMREHNRRVNAELARKQAMNETY